jgi:hypothetical protein
MGLKGFLVAWTAPRHTPLADSLRQIEKRLPAPLHSNPEDSRLGGSWKTTDPAEFDLKGRGSSHRCLERLHKHRYRRNRNISKELKSQMPVLRFHPTQWPSVPHQFLEVFGGHRAKLIPERYRYKETVDLPRIHILKQ